MLIAHNRAKLLPAKGNSITDEILVGTNQTLAKPSAPAFHQIDSHLKGRICDQFPTLQVHSPQQ
jgi:hypothetical protein